MENRWKALTEKLSIDPELTGQQFQHFLTAYGADERHYHDLEHIKHVLNDCERLMSCLKSPFKAYERSALEFAIWFHDVVYDTHRKDNEEQSAVKAIHFLEEAQTDRTLIARVAELIRCTAKHTAEKDDILAQVLLDADLSILSAERSDYKAYAEAIRKEYHWVPEEAYTQGRIQVLQSFLEREKIYFLKISDLEEKARVNLSWELQALTAR